MTETEAKESLEIIRKAIDRGERIFRECFISRRFAFLCIAQGLLIAAIACLYCFLPVPVWGLLVMIAADLVLAGTWKIKVFNAGALRAGYKGNIISFTAIPIMRNIISTGVLSLFIMAAAGIALGAGRNDWSLAYPLIMCGLAAMFATYAKTMSSYSYAGAAIASAAAALANAAMPYAMAIPLWIAFGSGTVILLLGILMLFEDRSHD